MPEPKVSNFEGWAVVEMFGHTKEVGFVTTEAYGAAVLFRCDTPPLDERDYSLERPEWMEIGDETRLIPVGAKVRRPAIPGKTRLIGPGAIYAITPCTEDTARRAIESLIHRPVTLLELPPKEKKALPETLPGEIQDREFPCCGGNPEEGHSADCRE